MKAYVHLADGFEEIEAITPIDILRRAGIETETVSIMGRLNVMGVHQIEVIADILFEDAVYDTADIIVLPGGGKGADNLDAHAGLSEKLLSFSKQDKWLAAICAAPKILGRLGILEGRKATIYPGMEDSLTHAKVSQNRVVTDGSIITSRGAGTAVEFALEIVARLISKEKADALAKSIIAVR